MPRLVALLLLLAVVPVGVSAADPAEEVRLSAGLRAVVLANLPGALAEVGRNWGHQKEVVVGVHFNRFRPERVTAVRNDGVWQRVRLTTPAPADSFGLLVTGVTPAGPGRTTFAVTAALDVRAEYETEVWKSGVRLTRLGAAARCRADLAAVCELATRVETPPGRLLPAAVVRVRVTGAELGYSEFVCERLPGLTGRPAEVAGDGLRRFVKLVRPDLERNLLATAEAAVVKAADTQDVAVGLTPPVATLGGGR